jgi:hypothetical protein
MITPPAAHVLDLSLGSVPAVPDSVAELPPALPRVPKIGTPQAGMPYWKLEAAYSFDLEGATYGDIARSCDLTINVYQ